MTAQAVAIESAHKGLAGYSGAQLQLIKRTVAKDTSPEEFDLFMAVAQMKRLDPFSKQISAIVFSKDNAEKRNMSIITTIDGMRAIAARSGHYRPDEDEPDYTYDESLKCPANPAGLVKAKVRIFIADAAREGGWKPATGVAYWEEFAPLKEDVEGGYTWEDTGEVWADSGKPKRRKVPRNANAAVVQQVEGNWAKMPRIMLAKCAEAQALRKAFPEDLSGLYEGAELERAQQLEIVASEVIAGHEETGRLARIGAANCITIQLSPASPLEQIPIGKLADRIMDVLPEFDLQRLRWFESANRAPLREFWARAQTDALEVKKELEKRGAELMAEAAKAEA